MADPNSSYSDTPADTSSPTPSDSEATADLNSHHHLTHAIHSLDLLNSQLGVAGASLVNLYHLQRQREAAAQPPPGYGQAPYPYQQNPGYQAPPANYQPQPTPAQGGYYQAPPQPQYAPPGGAPQPYYPPQQPPQNQQQS